MYKIATALGMLNFCYSKAQEESDPQVSEEENIPAVELEVETTTVTPNKKRVVKSFALVLLLTMSWRRPSSSVFNSPTNRKKYRVKGFLYVALLVARLANNDNFSA